MHEFSNHPEAQQPHHRSWMPSKTPPRQPGLQSNGRATVFSMLLLPITQACSLSATSRASRTVLTPAAPPMQPRRHRREER